MRNCPNCGSQYPENTIYCPNCGATLNSNVEMNQTMGSYQNPMGNENYGGMPAQNKTNTWCILGLVFAFLFPLLGLIFSIIGLVQVKRTGEKGKGLAIAGLIISVLPIALLILLGTAFTTLIWPSVNDNLIENTACMNVDSRGNYESVDGDIVCENFVCKYNVDGKIKTIRCDR